MFKLTYLKKMGRSGVKCTRGVDDINRYFDSEGKPISKKVAKRRSKRSGKRVNCVERKRRSTTPRRRRTRSSKRRSRRSSKRRTKAIRTAKVEVFYPVQESLKKNAQGHILYSNIVIGGTTYPINIAMININTVEGHIYIAFTGANGANETMFLRFNSFTGYNDFIKNIGFNKINSVVTFTFGNNHELGRFAGSKLNIVLKPTAYNRMERALTKINNMLIKQYKGTFVGKNVMSPFVAQPPLMAQPPIMMGGCGSGKWF